MVKIGNITIFKTQGNKEMRNYIYNEKIIISLFNELNEHNFIIGDADESYPENITLNEIFEYYHNGSEEILLSVETSEYIHVGQIDLNFYEVDWCKYSDSLIPFIPNTIKLINELNA